MKFHSTVWRCVMMGLSIAPALVGQTPSAGAVSSYQGLILDSDLRLMDARRLLSEGNPLPDFLSLRYRGTENNYAVFYDRDGKEALYRYRRDPFDDLASRKLRDLVPGQAYRVRGNFSGLLIEGVVQTSANRDYRKLLTSQKGHLVFEFASAQTIQPDAIFF